MTRTKRPKISEVERRAKFAACLAEQMAAFERWAWREFHSGKTHKRTIEVWIEADGFLKLEKATVERGPLG